MNKPQAHFAHPVCKCGRCAASRGVNVNHTVANFGMIGPTNLGHVHNQHITHQDKVSDMASFESALAIQQAMYRRDKPDYMLLAITARELGLVNDGLSEAIMVICQRLHVLSTQSFENTPYSYMIHLTFGELEPHQLRQYELNPAIRFLLSNDHSRKNLKGYLEYFESQWKRAYVDLPVIQLLNEVGPWRFTELSAGLFAELIQQQAKIYDPRNSLTFRKVNEVIAVCTSTVYAQFVRDAIAAGGLSEHSCRVAMNRLASLHLAEMKAQ